MPCTVAATHSAAASTPYTGRMRHPALLLLLPLLSMPPHEARAQQVHRCVDAGGHTVFSDRACADIGANARMAPADAGPGNRQARRYRHACPRTLGELSSEIGAAIQNQDLNRLSAIYDWSGVSDTAAKRLLDRLDAIGRRPLIDIVPVYPDMEAASPAQAAQQMVTAGAASDDTLAATAPSTPRPTALRIEQTLANGGTPSRTVFDLRRRFGCFWISL